MLRPESVVRGFKRLTSLLVASMREEIGALEACYLVGQCIPKKLYLLKIILVLKHWSSFLQIYSILIFLILVLVDKICSIIYLVVPVSIPIETQKISDD